MPGEEGGNPSEEGLSSLLPRTPSSHLPKTFVLIESPISGGRMNGIFWGLFFPVKGTRLSCWSGSHMRGSGGAFAPPGRVKGRQPIAAGGPITGFSRRDQPDGAAPCRRGLSHSLSVSPALHGGPCAWYRIPAAVGPKTFHCPIPQGKEESAIPDIVAAGKNRYIIPGSFNRKAEGGRRPSAARCGWRPRRSEPPQGRPKGFRFVRDGATLFVESLFGRGALYHAASLASRADVRCEKDPRIAHGMFG